MYLEALEVAQQSMELRACSAIVSGRGSDDAVLHAFSAAQAGEASYTDVLEVLGRQAACIVKDLDPMEAYTDPTAVEAMRN